ncbi:MAG: relaxase [Pseudomonadota bacterium]
MIPFASQRGAGRDLAIHLMNAEDNEYVELADLRGAIADDLPGAFAEWEAQAGATKCRNYLYSLSVNPDPVHGPMSRSLYDEYIARVETALGLEGQARAVVYHTKEDRQGQGREHCHVVWSRIDIQECKAIHMAFDHDKLMTVTRQFARDHGIELAPGYHKLEERKRQTYRQLSLYDRVQEGRTGLSREERTEVITELWKHRDDPAAFVAALDYHGYILATGKRPFVLVDLYGETNSLPKLIDDKAANTKAIRDFLGADYEEEKLPSVKDARALAKERRGQLKRYKQSQEQSDRLERLREAHRRERERLVAEGEKLRDRQQRDRSKIAQTQLDDRAAMKATHARREQEVGQQREAKQPKGLAALLLKVSGMELIRRQVYRHQDAKRQAAYQQERHGLRETQRSEREELQQRQQMQRLDQERKVSAQKQSHARQEESLRASFPRQHRMKMRRRQEHMPAINLHLGPPGRAAMPYKAKKRYISPLAVEFRKDKVLASDRRRSESQRQGGQRKLAEEERDLQSAFRDAARHATNAGSTGSEDRARVKYKSNSTTDCKDGRKR